MPKVVYQGRTYDMPWPNSGRPPTRADIERFARAQQRPTPSLPVPGPRQPTRQEDIVGPNQLSSQYEGPIRRFARGVTDLPRSIFEMIDSTGRESVRKLREGGLSAAPDVMMDLVNPLLPVKSIKELVEARGKPDEQKNAVTNAIGMLGLPGMETMDAIDRKDYARLAGQATTLGATVLGARRMGRSGKAADKLNRPTPEPTIPPPADAPSSLHMDSRLEAPLPTTADSMYGIRPRDVHEGNPLLSHVPRRLQPPGATQSLFDNLLPSRSKELAGVTSEKPTRGTGRSQRLEIDNDILSAADASPVPEIKKAAIQTRDLQGQKQSFMERVGLKSLSDVWRDIGMGSLEGIRRMGAAGQEIYRKVSKSRLDSEALAGRWSLKLKDAVEPFLKDPEKFEIYRRALDEGMPVPSHMDDVMNAVKIAHDLDAEVTSRATASGMGFKTSEGKLIPWRPRDNYWPHLFPKEFFTNKKSAIEALMKIKNEKTGRTFSFSEAEKLLRDAHQWGERLIGPQHGREVDAPGYRTDFNAQLQHIHDMARRIVEAEEFGPMDIADSKSPLGSLLANVSDPTFAGKVLSRHLGREEPTGSPAWSKVTKGVLKAETFMHLSQFALSNVANIPMVLTKANSIEFAKALGGVMTRKGQRSSETSGALQTIYQEALREYGGESTLSKVYMMHKSEGLNRSIASIAGQGTAKALFKQIKAGKGGKHAKARLEDLLLEKADDVIKQNGLTDDQVARAGGRMSELTQGRAQSIDLPPLWSGHPSVDMITLFKKYAFRQTKIIKSALTEGSPAQRAKNMAVIGGLLQVTGEAIGDTKAVIKGLVTGDIEREYQERGAYMEKLTGTDNELVNRFVANYMQAWALGLFGDALQAASSGQLGILKFLGGPVIGDATEIAGAIGQGNTEALGKKAAQSVPFVGSGMRERMYPTPKVGGFRLPTLPRPATPQLPR